MAARGRVCVKREGCRVCSPDAAQHAQRPTPCCDQATLPALCLCPRGAGAAWAATHSPQAPGGSDSASQTQCPAPASSKT